MTIKSFFSLTACAAALLSAATLAGCSADDGYDFETDAPIIDSLNREVHTARLHMTADLGGFYGDEGETASTRRMHRSGSQWQTGDTIYLQFIVPGNTIDGAAIYQGEGNWKVNYYGSLPTGVESRCHAYFFDGAKSATYKEVQLDAQTAIYSDTVATYLLEDNEMRVTANLKPMTGRIRFQGTADTPYYASGVSCYTGYSIKYNKFTSAPTPVEGTVGIDGYTPYYYGFFESENLKSITFDDKENCWTFTRTLPSTTLAQGHSGALRVPTMSDRNGWTHKEYGFRTYVNGVSFVMIEVEGGTFTMGATAEQSGAASDELPTHQVTLSSYYIGQTEVTQALWKTVTGYSPTSSGNSWSSSKGLGNNYPAYYISYDDVKSFITKLNSQTGRTFRMPTEAEWEYAARGGSKRKGYLYSGSHTIGDVAWYTSNSGSQTHPVAQMAANELGLFDMSGNVWEWCSDWYGSYSSSAQTNPTGPGTGSYRVLRGGSWNYNATNCRVAYRNSNASSVCSNYYGFRLALSVPQE